MAAMADWVRLGEAVKSRRVQLGLHRQQDLASLTGLTRRVLSDIEHGRRGNYDKETLLRLEQALEWRPGSVQSVLSGGDPLPAENLEPSALSLDPRSLERFGDDQELLATIAEADLSPADAFRTALWLRRRRAEQHAELVAELRDMLGLDEGLTPGAPAEQSGR